MARELESVHFVGGGSDRILQVGGMAAMWDGKHITVTKLTFDPKRNVARAVGRETADGTVETYEFFGCPLVVKYREAKPPELGEEKDESDDSTPTE